MMIECHARIVCLVFFDAPLDPLHGVPGALLQGLADRTRPRRRARAVREPLEGGLRQLFGRAPGTAYAPRFPRTRLT